MRTYVENMLKINSELWPVAEVMESKIIERMYLFTLFCFSIHYIHIDGNFTYCQNLIDFSNIPSILCNVFINDNH